MTSIKAEIAKLHRMTPAELREKYAAVFGERTRSGNKPQLIKKIAWRIQADVEGGLSARALRRAEQLARESDVRLTAPHDSIVAERTRRLPAISKTDDRLPPTGSVITREYKRQTIEVTVLDDGFEYDGEVYRSLSAVAKAITGSHCNGFLWFQLGAYAP